MKLFILLFTLFISNQLTLRAQESNSILGHIYDTKRNPISEVSIRINGYRTTSDSTGKFTFTNLKEDTYTMQFSHPLYEHKSVELHIYGNKEWKMSYTLTENESNLEEFVLSGNLKETALSESPIPIMIYRSSYFKRNPSSSLFDGLENINGVRPQLNCNVCNTGDIHINGLEGPYTLVLIDGMPIVSGLSSVYGLSGIPQALIERIEVVKGPASTLYGSEAVGGLINVITKKHFNTSLFSVESFGTSWGELNTDIGGKYRIGKKATALLGVNYFRYQNKIDKNEDNFTDLTLQDRLSIFQKIQIERKDNKEFSLAFRLLHEDRWGGEMNWDKSLRGSDSIYAESIYTKRAEILGAYQFGGKEDIRLQLSSVLHRQNSFYGDQDFQALQNNNFAQLVWFKKRGRHDLLSGATLKHQYYDDNTVATMGSNGSQNLAENTVLPGIFLQDQYELNSKHTLLAGLRFDYSKIYRGIVSPRINYKYYDKQKGNTLRLSIGNGYRIANVFSEDHAALTGAREVIFKEHLNPEKSWNANVHYQKTYYNEELGLLHFELAGFYTYFSNKIIADFETNPNQIIYENLDGYSIPRGISVNLDLNHSSGIKAVIGATFMDVYKVTDSQKERQLFTERFSATWSTSYTIKAWKLKIDYTGNLYSPMRLPLLSELDPRSEFSSWWSIQNIQFTKSFGGSFELFTGIKNLLNWTPAKKLPFLIARANDPFDKQVTYDSNGQIVASPNNPYALNFDPNYMYASNQGMRIFLGLRYSIK